MKENLVIGFRSRIDFHVINRKWNKDNHSSAKTIDNRFVIYYEENVTNVYNFIQCCCTTG